MTFPNLSALWHEVPIVVIDTETTGLDASRDQVVEIAAVRFEAGRVTSRFSSLVNPGIPIPDGARKVHGITDDMVRGAPRLVDLAAEIFMVADGAIACAYNAPFDRRFLHAHITGTDCAAFDPAWAWIDVMVMIKSPLIDKYVKGSKSLSASCFRWQVAHQSAHRALGDAQAAGELLWRLFECGKIRATTKLDQILSYTDELRDTQEREHAQYRARKAGSHG